MKRALFLGILCGAALELFAVDYGVTLHQSVELSGQGSENFELAYTPGLGPWLSDSSRDEVDFYISALINMKYEYNKSTGEGAWRPVPDLGRCSLSYRPAVGPSLEFGRVRYNDPNSLIAAGLFDGAVGGLDIGNSRLSLGALYSGFLYQETAKIFMTAADSSWNCTAGDTGFSFAGRRLIAALDWEFPSLFESPHGLAINTLLQFDLNGAAEHLNTQYLSFKFTFSPLPAVYARAGAALGFAQYRESGETERGANLAMNLGLDWSLPGAPKDVLSFGVIWASGEAGDSSPGPFRSVTLLSTSGVLSAGMAGLAVLRGSYTISPLKNLSLGMDCRYFFRGNLSALDTLPLVANKGKRALGGEIYGSVIWVPVPDISLAFGGGLFFPALGNAVVKDTPTRWKTALTLAFSI
jgi:hypothetical protein